VDYTTQLATAMGVDKFEEKGCSGKRGEEAGRMTL